MLPDHAPQTHSQTALQDLDRAARELRLPMGGAWGFSVVGGVHGCELPAQIQKAAPRRQRGFAAGRRAAALALRSAGGAADVAIAIGSDQLPVWPEGWHGSISHTDDLAAAAVVPDCLVLGVDLEQLMTVQVALEVAPAVMPEGTAGFADIPLAEEVCRVFSAKEALYKALFPQTREFRDFSAAKAIWARDAESAGSSSLSLQLTEDWGAGWCAGRILQVGQALTRTHVLSLVCHSG